METVAGRPCLGIEAVLQDYASFRVRNAEYPGILPVKGSTVRGTLYPDIDEGILRALDEFEGPLYRRAVVEVTPQVGAKVKALVYAIPQNKRELLSQDLWDFERFLKFELEDFMQRYFS